MRHRAAHPAARSDSGAFVHGCCLREEDRYRRPTEALNGSSDERNNEVAPGESSHNDWRTARYAEEQGAISILQHRICLNAT